MCTYILAHFCDVIMYLHKGVRNILPHAFITIGFNSFLCSPNKEECTVKYVHSDQAADRKNIHKIRTGCSFNPVFFQKF